MMRTLLFVLLLTVCVNVFASVQFFGDIEPGGVVRAKTLPGTEVFLNDKPVQITPGGNFVFGFSREPALSQSLRLVYPDGLTQLIPFRLKKRHYQIQKVNGISNAIVRPSAKAQARAAKDSKAVKKARNVFTDSDAFMQDFIWPLTGRISGVYGSQRFYNGKAGRPHFGVDVAAKTGTPVVAPADGVISLAVKDMFYSGGTLIIDHGYGLSSSFLHLSKLYVKQGDKVKQGQAIAEVGATGRATGPHLDWRINWFQMRLDPVSLVPPMSSMMTKQ